MEKIEKFLKVDKLNGDGSGYGDGSGSGYGDGYGSGDDDGDGLLSFNNKKVYLIDSVQTIIESVRNNIAKGFIINYDLTLTKCFIVKGENCFSHGDTLKQAMKSLQEKLLLKLPISERIKRFLNEFKKGKKYKAIDFYNWHFFLTGSCEFGRKNFVLDKGIDLYNDKFTVSEFIDIVENNYGSDIIKQLKEYDTN